MGIEEAMANDLAYDLSGSPVLTLGSAAAVGQCCCAVFEKAGANLEVALFGVAEFLSSPSGSQPFTFAFDEHSEFESHLVVFVQSQGAALSHEREQLGVV